MYLAFGIIFSIFLHFLINISNGAFVEIGNLPATISLHEDVTDTPALVFSVSVYPTTATCVISSGDTGSNFDINDIGNGESQVSTIATPSFSNALAPTYILTIQCSDSGATDSQDLTVNIDANANFVLTNFVVGIATTSVNAKTVKTGHVVFTVEYTDEDGDSPLTYSITSTAPAGAPFQFSAGTDFLTASEDLLDHNVDFYTIYFDASDKRNTQSLELRITITAVNTPPEITNLDHNLTLPELTPGRKHVFTINYVDNDGDPIRFEIVSKQDTADVFDIILSSGEVYLKEGFELDFETTTQYMFELTIKDEYHYTTEPNGILTINIADVNEAPFWPSELDPVSVDESAAGAIVGTPSVLCDDPDGIPDISAMEYRILFGTYSSYFTINQTTAQVSFNRDWNFDDKTLPETFSLTLQCVDPDGVTASANYVITILDINDNDPVCYPFNDSLPLTYAQAVNESITHLNCTDADSTVNAELEYAIIGVNKGYGKTYFNVDLTGNLTITTEFTMEYNSTFYVTVKVKDKGSPVRSTTVTLTVSYLEKPIVNNYQEITTCFFCTTASVTLVAAAGFVVAMLCIFLATLCVLRCCYTCEKGKMRKLIASELKEKARLCDCCRPKHRRHRRKKNAADISKVKHKKEEKKQPRERIKEENFRYTEESKNQYSGVAPPGTVVSIGSRAQAEVTQTAAQDSQWNKFRKNQ